MITQPKPDRLYDSARELATKTGYASATLFRRYFSISSAHAQKLRDLLIQDGHARYNQRVHGRMVEPQPCRSLDDVPEPYRSGMRRILSALYMQVELQPCHDLNMAIIRGEK